MPSVDRQSLSRLGHLPFRSIDALACQLRSRSPIETVPLGSMPAFTNDQGTIMMQGKPMENEADTVKGPLPSMKRHCAFRDKSPRGEAASWECVHFRTRPRHAPAPSRMLASIKGVARTGRNAVERRRGVTIGTDCIVRHFCHWSSCPGGMMCSSASTLAAERRRIDRMRKNGSLKGKDALSMRRGTRS